MHCMHAARLPSFLKKMKELILYPRPQISNTMHPLLMLPLLPLILFYLLVQLMLPILKLMLMFPLMVLAMVTYMVLFPLHVMLIYTPFPGTQTRDPHQR
jgi:hypothetical protein